MGCRLRADESELAVDDRLHRCQLRRECRSEVACLARPGGGPWHRPAGYWCVCCHRYHGLFRHRSGWQVGRQRCIEMGHQRLDRGIFVHQLPEGHLDAERPLELRGNLSEEKGIEPEFKEVAAPLRVGNALAGKIFQQGGDFAGQALAARWAIGH